MARERNEEREREREREAMTRRSLKSLISLTWSNELMENPVHTRARLNLSISGHYMLD
jgi:hypothetical protein